MATYFAYGLGIRSELSLPEAASKGRADVVVRFGKHRPPSAALDSSAYSFRQLGDEVQLRWAGVGRFRIRAGREVVIEPYTGIDEGILRALLLGPALAVLLHQRGALILHGSAVVVNDRAVGFLGETGAGKSTTAATLHARGYPVLADDVIAVSKVTGIPFVLPAYPQVNLWPDSAASLGKDLSRAPKLHPGIEKRAIRATSGFPRDPLPLHCLYVLGRGSHSGIEPLQPQEAFVALLQHSYGTRLVQGSAVPVHFKQCANLVTTISIRRLTVRPALSELQRLACLVEENAFHNVA